MSLRNLPLALLLVLSSCLAASVIAQVDPSAAATQKIVAPSTDADWQPSAEQRERIEKTTRAYFAARDSDRAEDAYSQLSPRQKQFLPFDIYRKQLADFNARAGAVQGRQLRAITWYKDAPQSGPGIYVAVDYASGFSNLALHCGYVVWQEETTGRFLLIREETNVIDHATMNKLTPSALEKVRNIYRC
jgi:hypothetical protein